MELPFWHRYVIMAAKIVSKLGIPLTMWVSAHRFAVTSTCLCGTFPKFGDLLSHRDNMAVVVCWSGSCLFVTGFFAHGMETKQTAWHQNMAWWPHSWPQSTSYAYVNSQVYGKPMYAWEKPEMLHCFHVYWYHHLLYHDMVGKMSNQQCIFLFQRPIHWNNSSYADTSQWIIDRT